MDHDLRRQKLEALVDRVAEGMRLNQMNRPEEAAEVLRACRDEAIAWECTSALIAWQLGVAYDLLGVPLLALRFIGEALRADPFPAPFRASAEIIANNCRVALAAVPFADLSIPKLVGGLKDIGLATPNDLVAVARHLYVTGQREAALAEAEAALRIEPDHDGAQMAHSIITVGLEWAERDPEARAAQALASALGGGQAGEA